MGSKNLNPYNHLTAKERDKLSFPAKVLYERGLLTGSVLDFGSGFGSDAHFLNKLGIDTDDYDKFYAPDFPTKSYDTIICLYVLNVLFPEEQATVIQQVTDLLKPGGIAYFAVRRDIRFEGFRTHKLHKKPTYQCNVVLDHPSILRNDYCEIYVLKQPQHLAEAAGCPYCALPGQATIIADTREAYAIYALGSQDRVLVIPRLHQPDFFELPIPVQESVWFLVRYVREVLQVRLSPDGFSVELCVGEAAGQVGQHACVEVRAWWNRGN
jgi:ATP adenylyltransferase